MSDLAFLWTLLAAYLLGVFVAGVWLLIEDYRISRWYGIGWRDLAAVAVLAVLWPALATARVIGAVERRKR